MPFLPICALFEWLPTTFKWSGAYHLSVISHPFYNTVDYYLSTQETRIVYIMHNACPLCQEEENGACL
jgi:hypothetical protein